ncbi:MAG: putative monovalent cation/H+ antiporter subunit A [Alcanivoracaceae bacterium]|nr:putative monovalent cation/H+ antiporter subunit A [Alcanivoracaceae bacterium]
MLYALLGGFGVAALAPWLHQLFGRHSGWALALWPATLFIYFASMLSGVNDGPVLVSHDWIPSLGIQLSFMVDGLSLLFALLISGIGVFIVAYAGRYLEQHQDVGRFYAILLAFMASMLGLVLSDNLISLFVFWELTSITSYLLIGFNHEDAAARRSALQGLFVTVGGGLALMTGLIMLAMVGGSYELSTLLGQGDVIREHAWYAPMLALILLGAFTKSAQFPFHFWLPNAMAAPTPVSAYLHSATMVKAGIYLLARLNPALGGSQLWLTVLGSVGAITLFIGIWLALRSTGIKKVLAYSTVMALGTLTMLIGLGTDIALSAAMAFLLAHSLYKGALFMIAGIIDHGTGSKDLRDTGGLFRAMPVTAVTASVAALSLAGVLPMFGFVAKELLFESVLSSAASWITLLVVAGTAMTVAVAALIGILPWYGKTAVTKRTPHEAPPALLAGPIVLATLGLLFGLFAPLVDERLLGAAVSAVAGNSVTPNLALWHGINVALGLSALTLALGLCLYFCRDQFRHYTRFTDTLAKAGPERGYDASISWLVKISAWQTRFFQSGYLRYYLLIILLTFMALVWTVMLIHWPALSMGIDLRGIQLHEYALVFVLVAAALAAARSESRLGAVASLGAVGFTVALLYVMFSAPDLGITQVLVETLTVILLVLVLFRLPGFLRLTSTALRLRDAMVASAVGITMTCLLLFAADARLYDSISHWHVAQSMPGGYGRNIVNVILVDFRALDTLGEIFVLALAATGVLAMIRLRAEDKSK